MKHTFLSIQPNLHHGGLVPALSIHINLHPCEQLLANVYKKGPEHLKIPFEFSFAESFGNDSKKEDFYRYFKEHLF